MKPVMTLVLVASEAEARILENAGVGRGLTELQSLDVADFPDADQEFTDRRVSAHGAGGIHQGTDARESVRDAKRSVFTGYVIAALEKIWAEGGYDRLIIAASPRLLGEIRAHLPKTLAAGVTAELAKDIVKLPLRDLTAHFAEVAAF